MEHFTLLIFITLYLLITLAIGWWASKKVHTTADFVVAGKRLPTYMAACALFATWFGSETVMGASSEFVEHGILGIIEDPFGAALCLFLAGLLIAKPLYKLNLFTFNDFFRMRFGKASEVVSAFFMIPSYFGWIAAQLVAMAIILQTVTGLDKTWGVIICCSLVLTYTYIGGMWSVSITDFVQTIAIIIGLFILAVDMVGKAGGFEVMIATAPPKFFNFFPEAKPMEWVKWGAAWMTLGLGSIPQQDVFQRVMAAKSEKSSVQACYASSLMYLTIAFLPITICYCGKMLYPELLEGDTQMMLPTLVLKHCSLGLQILFFGALISAILSTASGAMLAPATVLGENLIKPLYKNIDDAKLLRIMRLSVVGVAVVTCIMALMRSNIYELVGESSALSLVSLFVPLIGGLYWKRSSPVGAIASMVVGMAIWLIAKYLETEIPAMLYGFGSSILAMIIGSYLFPDKVERLIYSKEI
jgi:solute:Na+ symporter, SSS family